MAFCKNWKKWIAFTTLTLGCLIGRPLYTYATAGQQLEQAQRDKAKAENGLEKQMTVFRICRQTGQVCKAIWII